MELCQITLEDAIKEMNSALNQNENNGISLVGRYISHSLLEQILKGVNYLHSRSPPIIHRDLKESNILIVNNGADENFIKITDFGLSTIHGFDNSIDVVDTNSITHTKARGTPGYIAPEVKSSNEYDTKADIFSIGIIMKKLFCVNTNIVITEESDKHIRDIHALYTKLINDRRNCKNILTDDLFDQEMRIRFHDIVCEDTIKIKQLCYKFGELDYRPKIKDFTDYFLWNSILRHNIHSYENPEYLVDMINQNKIIYQFSYNYSQETLEYMYYFYYIKWIDDEDFEPLCEKLCDESNSNWFYFISSDRDIINWADSDLIIFKMNHFACRESKTILYDVPVEFGIDYELRLIYCHQNYTKYQENLLSIVNDVMNSNIEFKEMEINRQLNDLLPNKVFCYLTKYLYISEDPIYIEVALTFGEYNILISIKEIIKFQLKESFGEYNALMTTNHIKDFPLKENCLIELEKDKYILEKIFEDIFLDISCIKIIQLEDFICIITQVKYATYLSLANNQPVFTECCEHEYLLKFDDLNFHFLIHLNWINV
jgi:serine/threonine protein kinase